jgi:tetratricopeptide (TPR) repeat protein
MKLVRPVRIGAGFLALLFLLACAAGQKQYDVGMQLSAAGKYKEAIAYFEQALEKEPNNQKYQQALADLKEQLVSRYTSQGTAALTSQTPVTMGTINKAKNELAEARGIDASHPAVGALEAAIEKEEQALIADVQNLYTTARAAVDAGDWLKAYFSLQQIQSRFPNYEDSFQMLNTVSEKGAQALSAQARERFDAEDFKGAKDLLRKVLALKPADAAARELLAQAEERDSKAYFVQQAREAVMAQQWDRAVKAYERALEYDPQDQDLRKLIGHIRTKAGQFYIRKATQLMDDGWLLKAFQTYEIAATYINDPSDYQVNKLRRDLISRANYAAGQFKEQGRVGGAWFWYTQIKKIDPDYPDIFFLTQAMEDRIKERVQKSIAVFDFGSPSDNEDAGIIVANNLITFLFNNASGDIKILERENLKSILEEMKLGQIGVVSAASAKEMGRVYGIDVAIMGSVLLFKVDSSVSEGTKSVRYQIGEKIEDNIEYLNWKAKNPKPTPQQLAEAPAAKIKIPEYTEKDYGVSNHKKVGFVQLSFRIVDVRTGENIQVRTVERKETEQDTTSAGLPEANVQFDPLEIPTDTELLQKMTGDVVAELGREALRPLQNLEQTYFNDGEKLIRRRDKLGAAESFVNAVFDERLKRIQGSPLTQKAMENLDKIFRDYRISLGG